MKTGLKKKKGPLFVRAFRAVVRNPKLSLQARAVLSIIRSYANVDGSHCFPSLETIQKDAGCKRRTLERYIAELRQATLIHTEQRVAKGKKRSSNLFILFDEEYARIMGKTNSPNGGRPPRRLADGEPPNVLRFTEEIAQAV